MGNDQSSESSKQGPRRIVLERTKVAFANAKACRERLLKAAREGGQWYALYDEGGWLRS